MDNARGFVFDAGALGSLDDRDASAKLVTRIATEAFELGLELVVPASALAQALHDAARQTRLSRLVKLGYVVVAPLDRAAASYIGPLRKKWRHDDVVDVHVAWISQSRDLVVVTSDAKDMRKLGITEDRLVEV